MEKVLNEQRTIDNLASTERMELTQTKIQVNKADVRQNVSVTGQPSRPAIAPSYTHVAESYHTLVPVSVTDFFDSTPQQAPIITASVRASAHVLVSIESDVPTVRKTERHAASPTTMSSGLCGTDNGIEAQIDIRGKATEYRADPNEAQSHRNRSAERNLTDSLQISHFIPLITPHNEDVACRKCGGTPCHWMQIGPGVVESVAAQYPTMGVLGRSNNEARKAAYREFTYAKYGYLGKGNRVKLPRCALEGIRSIWPDISGAHMGVKED